MKTPYLDKEITILESYKKEDIASFYQLRKLAEYREIKQLMLGGVMHRFSTPEKMAEWLHNNYEEIALNNGWKTQDDCQVPFCDLPTENRLTMIELCIRYLNGA